MGRRHRTEARGDLSDKGQADGEVTLPGGWGWREQLQSERVEERSSQEGKVGIPF